MVQTNRAYEIRPRPLRLGGGYKATIFDSTGEEIACGLFPVGEEIADDVEAFNAAQEFAQQQEG